MANLNKWNGYTLIHCKKRMISFIEAVHICQSSQHGHLKRVSYSVNYQTIVGVWFPHKNHLVPKSYCHNILLVFSGMVMICQQIVLRINCILF